MWRESWRTHGVTFVADWKNPISPLQPTRCQAPSAWRPERGSIYFLDGVIENRERKERETRPEVYPRTRIIRASFFPFVALLVMIIDQHLISRFFTSCARARFPIRQHNAWVTASALVRRIWRIASSQNSRYRRMPHLIGSRGPPVAPGKKGKTLLT